MNNNKLALLRNGIIKENPYWCCCWEPAPLWLSPLQLSTAGNGRFNHGGIDLFQHSYFHIKERDSG